MNGKPVPLTQSVASHIFNVAMYGPVWPETLIDSADASRTVVNGIHTNRGSYRSAHVLVNLLTELGKRDNCKACPAFYLFFATSLIN